MVDGLHGEVPGHELHDRLQPRKGGADANAGKAIFGDGGVDDTRGPELVEQALRHLIGPLILGDLLTHDEDAWVGAHLLGHGVAERLAHGHGDHHRARRDLGFVTGFARRHAGTGRGHLDVRSLLAGLPSWPSLGVTAAQRSNFGHLSHWG